MLACILTGFDDTMICLLHGYLLEGSGSNLWTRAIVGSLCREGWDVQLVCQEGHPALYDFIAEVRRYEPDGSVETVLERETPYPGRCVMHRPALGDTLPVYVPDRYDEFERIVPMVELSDAEIEDYLQRNVDVVRRVVAEHGVRAIHANHAVLMSVVAQRVSRETGVPFAIMPHGSAIEYAVKKDPRFHRMAAEAFSAADRIYVIGDEMRERVREVFQDMDLDTRLRELSLGVDTSLFDPVDRDRRGRSIQRLAEQVEGSAGGRSPGQVAALQDALAAVAPAALPALLAGSSDYDLKRPDEGLAHRLSRVDWARDPAILFLGRLIPAKGVHCVLAALPLILERAPDARLVVVGHGPLREPLEAMRYALHAGDRTLLLRLLEPDIPGAGSEGLPEVLSFLEQLESAGRLDHYFENAAHRLEPDRVLFTGYLTHADLRHLFPCCDVAVFPSIVREAGPLVFLEALASGCFPLGTYFGGMAASIDAAAAALPAGAADAMKLSPRPERLVADIAERVPAALEVAGRSRASLRRLAVERFDWRGIADRLAADLEGLRRR